MFDRFDGKIGDCIGDAPIADEDESRAAIANDIGPIFGFLDFVHGDDGGAEAISGVDGHGEWDAIARNDGDDVAAFHAEIGETLAETFHFLMEIGVGNPFVSVANFVSEELAVGIFLRRSIDDIG